MPNDIVTQPAFQWLQGPWQAPNELPQVDGALQLLRGVVAVEAAEHDMKALSALGPAVMRCGDRRLSRYELARPSSGADAATQRPAASEKLQYSQMQPRLGTLDDSKLIECLRPYLELVETLFERRPAQRSDLRWEYVGQSSATRMFLRVRARLERWRARDEPPADLIVRLERRVGPVIEMIAKRPRLLLQRQREAVPVQNLREMDARCLDWLARQPGQTIPEKAGYRRSVLGITRYETHVTLENRVVAALVRSCAELSRDFLERYQPRFPDHSRVARVARFHQQCRLLLRESFLGALSPLQGIPQPNYALLNEARYREVWLAFLMVARRESRLSNVRAWAQRTWCEAWQLIAWTHIDRMCARSAARRTHLRLRDQPEFGQLIDPISLPSPWFGTHGERWDWVANPAATGAAAIEPIFADLDPDWGLRRSLNGQPQHLTVGWTVAGFDASAVRETIDADQLLRRLERREHASTTAVVVAGCPSATKVQRHRLAARGDSSVELVTWPMELMRRRTDEYLLFSEWLNHASS